MKVLRLAFSNLNSLRGTFTIDFENGPLAEAGLFAITGQTGVGKTTILDAITLGLFGKAARYDNNKASIPENMMSRGTGECFSEVVFSCASGVYSVRWDLARARKKPDGRVQTAKRQIATIDGDILESKIREVDNRVEALTGLDYNRFLRSVLLAQGRFKEFLDADRKERSELLEKITGTKIYSELSMAAFDAARVQRAGIDQAKQALDGIRLLDADAIVAFREEQLVLKQEQDEGDVILKGLSERIGLYDQMLALRREQGLLGERLALWTKERDGFAAERKRIEIFDRASPLAVDLAKWQELTLQVKECLELQEKAELQVQGAQQAYREAAGLVAWSCSDELRRLGEKRTERERAVQRDQEEAKRIALWLESHQKDAGIAEALAEVRIAGEQCRRFASQRQDRLAAIKAIVERIGKTETAKRDLELRLKAVAASLDKAVAETKSRAQERGEALDGKSKGDFQKELKAAQERRIGLRELLRLHDSCLSELSTARERAVLRDQETVTQKGLEEKAAALADALKLEQAILKDKETIHLQAQAISSLEQKRAELLAGEACPLCGSLEHPYVSCELPSESQTRKQWDQERQKVDTLLAEEKGNAQAFAATSERLRGHVAALADLDKRIARSRREFADLAALLKVGDLRLEDKEGLLALGRAEAVNCERIEAIVARVESIEKSHAEAEKAEAKVKADAANLSEQIALLGKQLKDQLAEKGLEEMASVEATQRVAESLVHFSKGVGQWLPPCEGPSETGDALLALEGRSKEFLEKSNQEADTKKRIADALKEIDAMQEASRRLEREQEECAAKLLAAKIEIAELGKSSGRDWWEEAERRRRMERAGEGMTRAESERGQKKASHRKAVLALEAFDGELKAKVAESGFAGLPQLSAVLAEKEAIEAARLRNRKLENEKLEIDTLIARNAASLKAFEAKDIPDETKVVGLREEAAAVESRLKEKAERQVELRLALEQDAKARSEQKEQIERIRKMESDAKPWFVLSDLIGSASGSVFSQFAQGLTLAQLVVYANKHLAALNPRYYIHRTAESDLELEIIDRYEADAVRPTRSLSGGESFLVSLALALGLSELAGRNTRIESLFIDEGFGSLDSDTLEVALSALENLRWQNRTIGVISHVEALKVRIGTQVQVMRRADGQAELKVVD